MIPSLKRKRFQAWLFLVAVCLFGTSVQAETNNVLAEQALIEHVFNEHHVIGTMVLQKLGTDKRYIHNLERAQKRYSPASTFKIPNTLIALDQGHVQSKKSPFKWDGTQRWLESWNQDQTLQTAYRVSCVWCYQELARKIGRDVYLAKLKNLGYGNQQLGQQVDQFWLDGSLAISALEQVDFLTRLANHELPYPLALQQLTQEIMLEPNHQGLQLHAKTGWAAGDLNVGWYVGYLKTTQGIWVFAMNMDMSNGEQAPLRKRLVIKVLDQLGLIKSKVP